MCAPRLRGRSVGGGVEGVTAAPSTGADGTGGATVNGNCGLLGVGNARDNGGSDNARTARR